MLGYSTGVQYIKLIERKDRDRQMSAKEKEAAANRHRRFYRLFYE